MCSETLSVLGRFKLGIAPCINTFQPEHKEGKTYHDSKKIKIHGPNNKMDLCCGVINECGQRLIYNIQSRSLCNTIRTSHDILSKRCKKMTT